jgi:hypothetical protein
VHQEATVESGRGAVLALRSARFPGPLTAPGVRVSTHRALHVSSPVGQAAAAAAGFGVQGVGMVLPR